jgi:hypothetical protein
MTWAEFDPIADFFAEDPIERLGVLGFSISGWLVAVANDPPMSFVQSVIQIVPPILGIWVAHRSMERAHQLRMEKLRQSRASARRPNLTPNPATSRPEEDTVDL